MKVKLVEVGPRDGFQNVEKFIPTEVKLAVIDGLVEAGYKKIQVTSFVSPAAIPQMRDATEITATVLERYPEVDFCALVPNFRGAVKAYEAGIKEINPVISLSESHNMANVKRTREESVSELIRIREAFPDLTITQDIATAFACPFEGEMEFDPLVEFIGEIHHKTGIESYTICDTVGMAYPKQVEDFFRGLAQVFPGFVFNVHIHDTRNMGLINTYTALLAGAHSAQSSIGGLGGCPFAPGASGNTASEDLVYMLNKCGLDTGIDFQRLLKAAKYAFATIPEGIYSSHWIRIPENPRGKTQ